jgi:3-oxoacyl-[acyl-carrier-protein] synthase III
MKKVYISSLGYYIPSGRLSNQEVLESVREANKNHVTPDDLDLLLYGNGRKFEFLGIESRSVCRTEEGENAVMMAVSASRNALHKAEIRADQIDCIIMCGVSNPFREPSFALVLARRLGLEAGDFFDINDTCNGFLKSMELAGLYLKTGKYRNILIAVSENPYELARGLGIDYRLQSVAEADNRFSSLLVGSGAAAVVLSSDGNGKELVHYRETRETLNWDASIVTIPGIGFPDDASGRKRCGFYTDARLVSAEVIKELPAFAVETVTHWNMSLDDFKLFIMHQLGNNVTFATLDKLQLDHDKAPLNTFRECGNMAAANIPINLALAEEQGKISTGDSILLMSSACGLSYALAHILW